MGEIYILLLLSDVRSRGIRTCNLLSVSDSSSFLSPIFGSGNYKRTRKTFSANHLPMMMLSQLPNFTLYRSFFSFFLASFMQDFSLLLIRLPCKVSISVPDPDFLLNFQISLGSDRIILFECTAPYAIKNF